MKIISVLIAALTAICFLETTAYAVPQAGDISAKSAIVINADTGSVLFEKNAHEQRAMASTTKIMTALITLEAGDLDRQFVADSMAIRVEGTSMGLREGDIVTRRALCYGMLLPSGNDAANAAAVNIAGTLSAFAERMNKRAAQIGMKDTHFVTPSGLDADGHYTTAYDMALLTREALKNEEFRKICCLQTADVEFGAPPYKRTLGNSNKLLYMYDGCIGVKTGFTDNARRCLVSAAERNGCTLIAVTLNAPDDWNDHIKMLDSGFEMLRAYNVGVTSFAVPVIGGAADNVTAVPAEKTMIGLTAEEAKNIRVRYSLPEFVYADITEGEQLGYADIYLGQQFLKRVKLVADESVERASPIEGLWDRFIMSFTG